ncbi:MAG TPA: prepilin-type N-terminal cleavage/methylation domain-containing protein, partial [Candidatus Latescibacteria bacterium]|nr:prepilin-type N-terminal cleavage/methylation domain-containing protein [Candidatus Latescibacterota bacterium]
MSRNVLSIHGRRASCGMPSLASCGMPSLASCGMPSLGAAEGRHGNPRGGFHARPTLRGVRACHARGFTLVELLVVVVILAILGGMVSGALIVARSSAREAATRATIAKLHNIIMAKYESYRTRRVPLSDQEMHRIAVQYYGLPAAQPLPTRLGALIRLRALRDIMRMEMPDRWTDVLNGSTVLIPAPDPSNPWIPDTSMPPDPPTPMLRPSLSQSYYTRFRSVWFPFYSAENGKNVDEQTGLRRLHEHAPAECLYMFITAAGGEDARRQFRASEIGDTDGDGFPEFLDGWGRPIFFLRWAPAFNDSDFQPDVVDQTDLYATSPGDE